MMDSRRDDQPQEQQEEQHQAPPRKVRVRRPRGRGLRTRTGCLTCRKRHKKCDEKQPICGPCSTSSRDCVFPRDLDAQAQSSTGSPPRQSLQPAGWSADGNVNLNGTTSEGSIRARQRQDGQPGTEVEVASFSSHLINSPSQPFHAAAVSATSPHSHGPSPASLSNQVASPSVTSNGNYGHSQYNTVPWSSDAALIPEKWTADFASTRWLDLLANDAAQADVSFSLAPTPEPEDRRPPGQHWKEIQAHVSPALLNGQAQLPPDLDPEDERRYWQSEGDVLLTDHEAVLFRHFAERCARWLDVFDSQRLFSTYAVRLSLRNVGLMKAILALSAKHRTKCLGIPPQQRTVPASPADPEADSGGKDDEWIGYYYETLHYVRKALAYSSYTHSEELLATAVVISSYEMLDESDGSGNWQRHLKGVFWIQRSQDSDGGCGGLRQSVWWAWLRQDIWAAFREKRPCLSFWKPKKALETLDQHELADRAVYLLSQAVNYSAEARKVEAMAVPEQLLTISLGQRRADLLAHMARWKSFLGDEYNVLPTPRQPEDVFAPLWVHPPEFGAALQAYNFALILITLHTPGGSGLNAFLRMQKQLAAAVNVICGIAMALTEESCQLMSAQCLFGAGLCVQNKAQREKIIDLMGDCEARVGWAPISKWREDLRAEWAKADGDLDAHSHI